MTIKSCSKKASNQLFYMYWYVSFAHFPPSNCLYSPCLPQKGNLVHTLDHVSGKSCGEGGAGQKAETRRPCVVYSLAYHHKETCLLTAGSYGPVKVWKGQEWSQEDDSIDQWYIGWIITMETEIQTISTKLLWALEDLRAYKTYNIWLCLTQFISQVLILSSLYKRLLVSCHTHVYMRRGRQLLLTLLPLWFVCEGWSMYWWFSHINYPGRTNTFISYTQRSLTQGMSCTR